MKWRLSHAVLATATLCGLVLAVASFFLPVAATTRIKWLTRSATFKSKVSALPSPSPGALRHIEWDGWGFPGAGNTVVYLVFDPENALSVAARREAPGSYPGLPCKVSRVSLLESQWYTVQFFTDTDWDHCE